MRSSFHVSLLLTSALLLALMCGGVGINGNAYDASSEVPANYAPPWNVFDKKPFVGVSIEGVNGNVYIDVTAQHKNMLFYRTFYLYDRREPSGWKAYNFSEKGVGKWKGGSNWLNGSAKKSITVPVKSLGPENWVLVYACAPTEKGWRCGCFNNHDNICKKWSVQNFTLSTACENDTDCATGEKCIEGDCVVKECPPERDYDSDGDCDSNDSAFLASIASLDTLRAGAEKNGILIGALSNLNWIVNEEYAPQYKEVLGREFNLLIANGWFRFLVPEEGRFDSKILNRSILFAKEHNMMLTSRSVIYRNKDSPDWMRFWDYGTNQTTPDCGGWNESEENRTHLAAIMEEYISQYAEALGDALFIFKVVNEPLRGDGVIWPYNCWNKIFGEKYIDMAFSYAKAAAPKAKMMLNENFGRADNNEKKLNAYLALLTRLKSRDVPVDVAGIQLHLRADQLADNWTLQLNRFFNETAKLGLDSAITEMDVSWGKEWNESEGKEWNESEPLEREKEIYRQVMDACLEHERCIAFMTWGISDRRSWITNGRFSINKGLEDSQPLLFDSNFSKKPAYYGILESLKEHACPAGKSCDLNGDGHIDSTDVSLLQS